MHWFLDPIQYHYIDFEGRVGRQEFWMWVLCSIGLQIILEIFSDDVLLAIVGLVLAIPSLALGARRLHDIGKSGWWQLLVCVPFIGWVILIVWSAQETVLADNEYGAPAKPKVVVATRTSGPVSTSGTVAVMESAPVIEDGLEHRS